MIERVRKKWMLSVDNGVTFDQVVSPLNTQSIKYSWARDLKQGQQFFRKKLTSALRFGKPDFDLFYNLERTPVRRCSDLYIQQRRLCEGRWIRWWTGVFSPGAGKYDHDLCQFEVKPDVDDPYTCIIDKLTTKVNILDVPPETIEALFTTPIPFVVTYDTARPLYDVLVYLLDQTECEYNEVVSDFFEWNPIGDAPGYVAGNNYVTGLLNRLDLLYIMQKSDAIDPTATNPATLGEMTLKEFFDMVRKMFNVYWHIDDDGNVRLEHWKFYVVTEGLDLTQGENGELNLGVNKYEHLSQEIPKYERFRWADLSPRALADYDGLDIIYDTKCVLTDDREAVEENHVNVTTNIVGMYLQPNISPNGFAMVACKLNPPSPNLVWNELGPLSGINGTNMPLSWAALHRDFFTWNRYLKRGNMNGVDVTFNGFVPNIQQPDLKARMCCGMEEWDPLDTVKTELGEKFLQHRQGHVEKAELEDFDDRLTITLRYAY